MDEKKRAPKLRFKGFTDDWEQRKLGDLVNFYGGLTYHPEDIRDNGTFIIRSSNIKDGQLVTKDNIFVNPKVVNSSYVKKGDIIVVVRNGSKSLIGKHTKLNFSLDNAVIGAFMTGIRSNNTDFINALFDSDNYKKEIQKNLGATINQITTGNFKKMQFYIPSLIDEKINLGSLIRIIDNLLVLQQRKLDQLKLLKKAMFQQLFTDNKTPILRFRGFNIAWKQCTLGDLVKIVGGGTPSTKISKYWNGNINWYSPTEIGDQIYVNSSKKKITELGLKNSSAKILPGNRTILFTSRAGIGDMAIMTNDGTTNQGFQSWVINSNKVDIYFLYSLGKKLKKQAFRKASGSTFLEISNSEVKKLSLFTPSFEEQTNIGNFLKTIDNQITLQQENINRLEQMKKFLLQNMFI